jgi:hypothetical protein
MAETQQDHNYLAQNLPEQSFLVRPYERLGFMVRYLAAMVGMQWAMSFLLPWLAQNLFANGIARTIIIGSIQGTILGIVQWLTIRRYIPKMTWIGVTALGIACSAILSLMMQRTIGSNFTMINRPLLSVIIISSLLSIVIPFLTAYFQSRLLKPYVINAYLWIWMPLITGIAVGIHRLPSYLGLFANLGTNFAYRVYLINNFLYQAMGIGIVVSLLGPLVQAIVFCYLRRGPVSEPTSQWLQMPDVKGIKQRWKLWTKVQKQLVSTERPNPEAATEYSLTYLVGFNNQGELVDYQPCDRISAEHIDATPLPLLTQKTLAAPESVAKFKAQFAPLSGLTLLPLIHISLTRMIIWSYVGLLVLGFLVNLYLRQADKG